MRLCQYVRAAEEGFPITLLCPPGSPTLPFCGSRYFGDEFTVPYVLAFWVFCITIISWNITFPKNHLNKRLTAPIDNYL